MADQVQIRRNTTSGLGSFVAAQGELIMDTTRSLLYLGNGSASPGVQVGASANGAHGALLQLNVLEGGLETIAAGASYSSTIQIPANAMVVGVSYFVGSSSITLSGGSSFEIGVSGTPNKFATGLTTLSSGSYTYTIGGPNSFYAATPLLLTPTAGSFTGGQIRLAIHYLSINAPTS